MDIQHKLAIRQELEALAIDFWHDVDFNWGRGAHDFYTEDAVFTTSVQPRTGRTAIQEFYRAREGRGARTSLHIVQNFRIEHVDQDTVQTRYIMSLYAADGEGILPSKPAIMVAEVRETAQRQHDGRWLYSARTLKALFRDDTPTTG